MPDAKNILTEDQAKTRWCPFARVGLDWHFDGQFAHFAANRNNDGEPIGRCIASGCMQWRVANEAGDGFCGLSGQP